MTMGWTMGLHLKHYHGNGSGSGSGSGSVDTGWISLSGIHDSSKAIKPDRTAFDLQHICMKLHRRNGLRQSAAMSVHVSISCVLNP